MKIAKYALEYYLSRLLEKSRPLSFRFHFFRIGGSGSENINIASAVRCKNDERLRENAHIFSDVRWRQKHQKRKTIITSKEEMIFDKFDKY